jgi:hypothetical protein
VQKQLIESDTQCIVIRFQIIIYYTAVQFLKRKVHTRSRTIRVTPYVIIHQEITFGAVARRAVRVMLAKYA